MYMSMWGNSPPVSFLLISHMRHRITQPNDGDRTYPGLKAVVADTIVPKLVEREVNHL